MSTHNELSCILSDVDELDNSDEQVDYLIRMITKGPLHRDDVLKFLDDISGRRPDFFNDYAENELLEAVIWSSSDLI